jgi:hypothetical protein
MWNERKMPKRWYELLRARMQVEEQRMRVIKEGNVIEDDHLLELLTEAHSLDREMLLVMRQAIAEALAREEVSRPTASEIQQRAARLSSFLLVASASLG